MEIVKKDIKYLNKDFGQFRSNLINFAKNYFPDTYSDFNESSPGMMFIEMAAYVGDTLNFYMDNQYREALLHSAEEKKNIDTDKFQSSLNYLFQKVCKRIHKERFRLNV